MRRDPDTHCTSAGGQQDERGGNRRGRHPGTVNCARGDHHWNPPVRPSVNSPGWLKGGAAASDRGTPGEATESPVEVTADRPKRVDQLVR